MCKSSCAIEEVWLAFILPGRGGPSSQGLPSAGFGAVQSRAWPVQMCEHMFLLLLSGSSDGPTELLLLTASRMQGLSICTGKLGTIHGSESTKGPISSYLPTQNFIVLVLKRKKKISYAHSLGFSHKVFASPEQLD